jgi:fluoroacetyl-CoA thioesterase
MANLITPGLNFSQTRTVTSEDTAAKYSSGLMEVFATPAMIAFMEHTSLMVIQKYLEPGFGTVGTNICVTHYRAVPVGKMVKCTAVLTRVEGNSLLFDVTVSDETGTVGDGTHTRYIIDEERFMRKFMTQKGK